MMETAKSRRRWPWGILAVLLLVAGSIGWRFRPMNPLEHRLVGTWRDTNRSGFTFHRSHTFQTHPLGSHGTWSASRSLLRMRTMPDLPTSWNGARIYGGALTSPEGWTSELSIEFDERGRLLLPSPPDEFHGKPAGQEALERVE